MVAFSEFFRTWVRYAVAMAAVAGALGVESALAAVYGVETPFALLLAATFCAAWFGGVGPGLASTLLGSAVVAHHYLSPSGRVQPADTEKWVRLVQYLVEGAFISVLSGLRRRSVREAQSRLEELRVTLRGIGDAVVAVDAKGRVLFANPVAERLAGGAAPLAGSEDVDEFLRGLDGGGVRRVAGIARRALEGGAVRGEEFECPGPEGRPVWLKSTPPLRTTAAAV